MENLTKLAEQNVRSLHSKHKFKSKSAYFSCVPGRMTFAQCPSARNRLVVHRFWWWPPVSCQQFENFSMFCDGCPIDWPNYRSMSASRHSFDRFSKQKKKSSEKKIMNRLFCLHCQSKHKLSSKQQCNRLCGEKI